MIITPMSDAEYSLWSLRSRAAYAQDKMRANGLTKDEAERIAEADFHRLLPDGLATQDHFLFSAKDEGQNLIGFIWYGLMGPKDNRRAFIYDVIIEEAFRGLGYGRQLMALAEKDILACGIHRVGLHVFGNNERAIGLYRSLGYITTDLVMEKTL